MNYGKFFRLNRSLSKIEEGIAIYDYVDLPAYFTPSVENHLSPKYPISVNITPTSVRFRLHYCALKTEGQKEDFENYTYYTYDSGDLIIETEDKYKSGDDIKVAHMEEVILELPFIENATSILSDIIKDVYITNFPQMIGGSTSTGGRYLEQLIHKRYPKSSEWKSIERLEKDGDIEALLYGTLREASDDSPSYSTLWLMDLIMDVEGEKDKKRIDLYNKKDGSVVAFLRKLLLDFMFDLKHSDVFQNSSCYQKMYSGLMSDFFFSALMHKCEYYYCRKLLCESLINLTDLFNDKEKIALLYGEKLFKAETLWLKDIMSPIAESIFFRSFERKKLYNDILENHKFQRWPSWFADPEEEMRRICFKTEDAEGGLHICSADTVVECLNLEKSNNESIKRMVMSRNDNRRRISQWFLKRYDFNDLFHLHFFENANNIIFTSVLVALMSFFGIKLEHYSTNIVIGISVISVFVGCILLGCWLGETYSKYECPKWNLLAMARFRLVWKRLVNNMICFISLFFVILSLIYGKSVISFIFVLGFIAFAQFGYKLGLPPVDIISYLHLTFPRLVAAITAAWFAMSMGFDIYVSFFDQLPQWNTAFVISIVVFGFIMYEINRIMPTCGSLRKIYRSVEFLIISYCVSLLVGVVVINFVGEKYLERGGTLETFFEQYVDYEGYGGLMNDTKPAKTPGIQMKNMNDSIRFLVQKFLEKTEISEADFERSRANDLTNVYHSTEKKIKTSPYSIVEKVPWGEAQGQSFFLMRDFLIMFSFIAMFWGIFISMIFTGEKQMTEL